MVVVRSVMATTDQRAVSVTRSAKAGYRTDCVSGPRVFAQVRLVFRVVVMPFGAWLPRVLDGEVVAGYAAAG